MVKSDKEISKIIMKKLKVCFSHSVSSAVWQGSKFEISNVVDAIQKQFILKILFPIEPLKKIKGNINCEIPTTWIDHLRNDHFPNFLSNKFPIKFTIIKHYYEHEVGTLYPKIPLVFPKQEVRFYEYKKELRND